MTAEKLKAIRNATRLPQRAFALEMGVPLRTYEDLESGKSTVRPIHLKAATMALIETMAIDDIGMVDMPRDVAEIIKNAYKNMKGV
ncbi:XRE family transcriptional regulator [Rhizobium ruizarguesonis]|uniref:helix-turn-helix domain-containing protein n=1 Tax=Rhizobium ruizarguesonis TaxID=2081791 RepID=UPI0010322549|nr:helix-turn-helix transcriptional regulator [Rhizobium ruizarguesonis]TBE49189.1 XRE family transcriptional regulator [Rhizobium ruizarguesonis]